MNIEAAMRTLIKQGTQDSNLKKNYLLKRLKKDAKLPGWEQQMREGLEDEWMLRLCMSSLINREYDWEGWGLREPRDLLIPTPTKWWDGKEKIDSLLILGEQGLGDEILFASVFNDVAKHVKSITVECDQRLVEIFSINFPNIEFVGRKHYVEGKWGTDDSWMNGRHWDAQTLMGDLPTWYRRKISDFPTKASYLTSDVDERYRGKVGCSWIGRQGAAKVPKDAELSLQYGVYYHEGLETPDIDLRNDITGLFKVVAGLEKVIAVPTSIVHIAGALGVPVEVLPVPRGMNHGGFADGKVNNSLNWRFHDRGSDWHPSVKMRSK